jgi:hypothetical protein
MAPATLTVSGRRADLKKLENRNADLRSEFPVLRLETFTVQGVQANFLSVLADGGHNVQRHGERAAAVFEGYQGLGVVPDRV